MSETLVNPDKREEAASAPAEAAARVNLLDFDAAGLKAWCESIGEKPFRARQLTRWVHRHLVCDFNEMTDLAKTFRAKLLKLAEIRPPEVIHEKKSSDGTRKWLFAVGNGNAVEAVFIPEDDRGTLCISSARRASRVSTAISLLRKSWASFGRPSASSAATAASRIRMTASSAMLC